MPLQIFCTISFSSEEGPRDAAATGRGEDGADEFLYGQEEDEEEEEEDAGAATDFVAFASSCTLHGLSHIFVEGSLGARQAFWALAFLLSLSVFLYQVADRIVYYLEYHHVTLLSEEDSPEMTFPAVTFCNINRVRVSQLSHEDLLYLAPLVDYEPGMELGFAPAQPSPGDEDEPLNLYGFFNRTCHQLEDMLLSCSYRGERCGPGDFAAVSSPEAAGHGEQLRPASCRIRRGGRCCPCQLAQGQADISAPSAGTWASRWRRHWLRRPAGGTRRAAPGCVCRGGAWRLRPRITTARGAPCRLH
ncbi:acid-sensing ion channel 1B-like [Balearica regulorum gibbericeps]|uniref:acid-sensing ion channel 1B-like n=1 Tax=Balearica regulorum gibbericeps TaxID=100784 RepID=UPI003F639594